MLDQVWSLNIDANGPIWTWFDAAHYARNDATAAARARQGEAAALQDYEERGGPLGYAPNLFFDPVFYLHDNPHVLPLIATGEHHCAFDHYRLVGWRDRNPHWLFDVARYLRLNPDLTPDAIDHLGGPYGHFLRAGAREGRTAHHFFDTTYYRKTLAISAAAADPFKHFLEALDRIGSAATPEPEASPYFSPSWYLATYQDIATNPSSPHGKGAMHHYLRFGAAEGRDPLCDFSETDYRQANPDVDAAIRAGQFVSAYQHFLDFGVDGSRSPSRDVDLAWYTAQPTVARDLAAAQAPNAFIHLLTIGIPGGLPLRPGVPNNFALDEESARAAFLVQAQRALPTFGRHKLDFSHDGPADLAVIMILRNQFALTMQCLASLRATYPGPIELILVDNASIDDTTTIHELVLGARIIRNEHNTGFLRACNTALEQTAAPTVLYLNNDTILGNDAIRLALRRLASDPTIGAVGAKVIRTHGLLQEAGCFLWRDGSADGWLRGGIPDAPEANFVRDVDFASGCFLLVDGTLLRKLGGFDDAFAPAYFEEVDLCLRIQAENRRVVYDPAVTITHYEYASSRSVRAASTLMLANRAKLRNRHAAALRTRVADRRRPAEAAASKTDGHRVLFLEDTIPLPRLGSGYGRAADALRGLDAAGWQVTVFPMHPVTTPRHQITQALPETAEILWDRDNRALPALLAERRGYFDLIWVSRAHNLRHLNQIVATSGATLEGARIVLDTEAVFSLRDAARARLDGLPFGLSGALAREFDGAWICDHIVAVNQAEAAILRDIPLSSVSVLGFNVAPTPTPAPWSERRGLLHVGALTAPDSPNCEGLRWFLDHIHPELESLVGKDDARLTVVGHTADTVDLTWVRNHPGVEFLGSVADLAPLYASRRVFVAPTRFAAGVATKVLDAAAYGLPIACTNLLASQLGWADTPRVLAAPLDDPAAFAANTARLVSDRKLWAKTRAAALEGIAAEYNPTLFATQLNAAVTAAGLTPPNPRA